MADEKLFTIPLRKEWSKAPSYRRTKKAVKATKEFIARHMKSEVVKIGPALNEFLWSQGNKNPPHKVKVHSIKEEDYAYVELVDVPFPQKKVEEKKSLKEKLLAKKEDKAPSATKETTETAEIQKEKAAASAAKEQKTHAGSKPVPGTPDKAHTPSKEEQKLQKTKKVIPQQGKKDSKDGKP